MDNQDQAIELVREIFGAAVHQSCMYGGTDGLDDVCFHCCDYSAWVEKAAKLLGINLGGNSDLQDQEPIPVDIPKTIQPDITDIEALKDRVFELEKRLDIYHGNMYDAVIQENETLKKQVRYLEDLATTQSQNIDRKDRVINELNDKIHKIRKGRQWIRTEEELPNGSSSSNPVLAMGYLSPYLFTKQKCLVFYDEDSKQWKNSAGVVVTGVESWRWLEDQE